MKLTAINKSSLLLAAFIFLLFFLNAYNLTFNTKPSIIHQWRQSDCLSIAKNYYEEGMHFFQPKIHWQGSVNGNAVGELPIINYTVAALWKIFGEGEGTYRLVNYLIYLAGIFVFFNTVSKFHGSRLLQFFFTSLLLTSPLLTYYSYNFLADVPALSCAIIALCFFIRFYYFHSKAHFYAAVVVASLAVLLKASAVVPLAIILLFFVSDVLNIRKICPEKLFEKKLIPSMVVLVCIIIVVSWYRFASNYNHANSSGVFLLGFLPIWEMEEKAVLKNLTGLLSDQFPVFMNRPMLFFTFLSALFVGFNLKLLDVFLKTIFIISAVFFVLFILLFFRVFDAHDYYLTNLMLFPVIIFICLAKILALKDFNLAGRKWLVTSIVIVIVFNSLYSAAFYRLRTIKDDRICFWYPFFTNAEKEANSVGMWMHSKTMAILGTITPDLRALGIKRDDFFMSLPDVSPNSSLYLMDQKGYTLSPDEFSKDTTWKSRWHFNDCKYFVLSDTVFRDSLSFKLIADKLERVYKKERVEVYKIKKD